VFVSADPVHLNRCCTVETYSISIQYLKVVTVKKSSSEIGFGIVSLFGNAMALEAQHFLGHSYGLHFPSEETQCCNKKKELTCKDRNAERRA
jgi:hypothetical protein